MTAAIQATDCAVDNPLQGMSRWFYPFPDEDNGLRNPTPRALGIGHLRPGQPEFSTNMKTSLAIILSFAGANAGDIRIVHPTSDEACPVVECLSSEADIENPESKLEQGGQISVYEIKGLKPGRYRVSYLSIMDPLSVLNFFMETHVTVSEESKDTVYLFHSNFQSEPLGLPKEIEEFLTSHRRNFITLVAHYDGIKNPILQARGGPWSINYLRDDCEYHLRVWEHSYQELSKDPKLIFERKFRKLKPLKPSDGAKQPE